MNTYDNNKEVEVNGQLGDVITDTAKNKLSDLAHDKIREKLNSRLSSNTEGVHVNSPNNAQNNAQNAPSAIHNNATPSSSSISGTARNMSTEGNGSAITGTVSVGSGATEAAGAGGAASAGTGAAGAVPGAGWAVAAVLAAGKFIKGSINSLDSLGNRTTVENDVGGLGKLAIFIIAGIIGFMLFIFVLFFNILPGASAQAYTSNEPYRFIEKDGFDAVNQYLENYNYYFFNKETDENSNLIDSSETDKQQIVYDSTTLYAGLIDCVFKDVISAYVSYIKTQYEDIFDFKINPALPGTHLEANILFNPEKSVNSFLSQPYPYCLKKANGSYYTLGDFINGTIPEEELNNDLNLAEFMAVLSYNANFSLNTFDLINFANYLCSSQNYKYYFEIVTTKVFEEYEEVITSYDCSCEDGYIHHNAEYADCNNCNATGFIESEPIVPDCINPKCEDGYIVSEGISSSTTDCPDCNGNGINGFQCSLCGTFTSETNLAEVFMCYCDSYYWEEIPCSNAQCLNGSITQTETTSENVLCTDCNGIGTGTPIPQKITCSKCNGEKKIKIKAAYKETCSTCDGEGYTFETSFIYTTISLTEKEAEDITAIKDALSNKRVPGVSLDRLPNDSKLLAQYNALKNENPDTPVFLREYYVTFTVKPYGLKELYALAGVQPWDFSDKFSTVSYSNLLDRTELYYRYLIDDIDGGEILGPSYLSPRSFSSTIYQDLILLTSNATGRSAYQYLWKNESDFDFDLGITDSKNFRSTEINYIDDGKTVVLDMFSPLYQADHDSSRGDAIESIKYHQSIKLYGNEECTYAMLLAYYNNIQYDAAVISKTYVKDTTFQLENFITENNLHYLLKKAQVNENTIKSYIKMGLPVLLTVSNVWRYGNQYYSSTPPHLMLIMGYCKDGFYVYDSGSKTNTTSIIPYDMFRLLTIESYIDVVSPKDNVIVSFKIEN